MHHIDHENFTGSNLCVSVISLKLPRASWYIGVLIVNHKNQIDENHY